ncbi:MAG: DeoR/GlpR family DNA-binding transcription regulator [Bacillus sp. (in: Bacteria)]|nr:DeoR/GlpR family DNA-binding transcription regulator [Bacillus sp. (in: firmicutes)]MCM1427490.1 DeoR/GlpR family DNA-binding transcription regulator [Eubacterium sp.]
MLAAERRNLILEKIHEDKKVIVGELSKEYDVSEETIRRDLDKLEEDGHVIKSYGGAILNEKSSIDLPFNIRWKANPQGKQRIAELISEEIEDGDHIMLDASTTAVFIAKNIKQKRHLTVVTNSIEILLELSDVSGWDIIAAGGLLKAGSMSLLGKKAADSIRSYHVDKVFFSCKGIDLENGVTDGNDETAGIKQNMIQAAKKVYLAVDSSKFGKTALSEICALSGIDAIVTDKKPDDDWLKIFDKMGITCLF